MVEFQLFKFFLESNQQVANYTPQMKKLPWSFEWKHRHSPDAVEGYETLKPWVDKPDNDSNGSLCCRRLRVILKRFFIKNHNHKGFHSSCSPFESASIQQNHWRENQPRKNAKETNTFIPAIKLIPAQLSILEQQLHQLQAHKSVMKASYQSTCSWKQKPFFMKYNRCSLNWYFLRNMSTIKWRSVYGLESFNCN